MRPKSETPDFELLPPSICTGISYFRKYGTDEKVSTIVSKVVQLQKSGTVFQPRRISFRNTTPFITYWKTVYENPSGIRYVVAYLLNFFK